MVLFFVLKGGSPDIWVSIKNTKYQLDRKLVISLTNLEAHKVLTLKN